MGYTIYDHACALVPLINQAAFQKGREISLSLWVRLDDPVPSFTYIEGVAKDSMKMDARGKVYRKVVIVCPTTVADFAAKLAGGQDPRKVPYDTGRYCGG